MVVELAGLDLDELVGRQPGALVVGHEDLAVRAPAHAVRGAEATGDEVDLAGLLVDRDVGATVVGALRHGGRTTEVDRDRQVHVELAVLVEHAEAELVEVAVEGVVGDLLLALEDARGALLRQLDQAGLLGDVDLAVDDLDALGLLEALGDPGAGHVRGRGGALDALEPPELAELDVALVVAVAAPGQDEQVLAVPLQSRDLRLEAVGTQVHEVVGGVDRVELEAVTGGLVLALALLEAGGGDAGDPLLGAQCRAGDQREVGVAGTAPHQGELLAAAGLEEVDDEVVVAGGQRGAAVLGLGTVKAVVVDDDLVVDREPRAVVADEAELVRPGGLDGERCGHLDDEVVLQPPEVLRGVPVDDGLELVDVRRLAGLQLADGIDRAAELEGSHGDAGLVLGRDGGRRRGQRGREPQREGRGSDSRQQTPRCAAGRGTAG